MSATLDVRKKLESLRKLLNEEDMNDAVEQIQMEWEKEDKKAALEREALTAAHAEEVADRQKFRQNEDVAVERKDVSNFYVERIHAVQGRSDF